MALLICMKQLAPTQKLSGFPFQDPKDKQVVFLKKNVFQTESSQTPPGWLVGFGSLDLRVAVAWLHPKNDGRGFQSTFPKFPKKT